MTDIQLVVASGATISGTVTLRRSRAVGPDPREFRIGALTLDGSAPSRGAMARVNGDGSFTLEGVGAGEHLIRGQAPRGWVLHRVTMDGRDITDTPVDLRTGQRIAVQVVFTDALTEISGFVTDEQGTPLSEPTVLAFPVDAALWRAQARQIATTRPDQTGRFQIRGLPAGEYFVTAIQPAEQGEWFEPSYLESHQAGAVRVTLADGEVKTHHLRVSSR